MIYLYTFILLLGITLFILALIQFQKTSHLLARGTKTEAIVTELIEVESGDGPAFKSVIEYTNHLSKKVSYTIPVLSNPAEYKVGDKVKIVYQPQNENDIKRMTYWGLYGWTIGLLAVGSPMCVIGLSYILYLGN